MPGEALEAKAIARQYRDASVSWGGTYSLLSPTARWRHLRKRGIGILGMETKQEEWAIRAAFMAGRNNWIWPRGFR